MDNNRPDKRRYITTDGLPVVTRGLRKGIVAATIAQDGDNGDDDNFYGPEGSSYLENAELEMTVFDIVRAHNNEYLDPVVMSSLQIGSRITQRVLARAIDDQTQTILARVGGSDYNGGPLKTLDEVINFLDRRLGDERDYVLPALRRTAIDYESALRARTFLEAAQWQSKEGVAFEKLLRAYNLERFPPELRPQAQGLMSRLLDLGQAANKKGAKRQSGGNPFVPLLANVYRSIADLFGARTEEKPSLLPVPRAVPMVTSKHMELVFKDLYRKSKDSMSLDEIHSATMGLPGYEEDPARNPLLRDATKQVIHKLTKTQRKRDPRSQTVYLKGVSDGAVVANHLIAMASMDSLDYLTPQIILSARKDAPRNALEAAHGLERLGLGNTEYVRLLQRVHREEEAILADKKDYPQSFEEVIGELRTNRAVRPDQKHALERFGAQYERLLNESTRVKDELEESKREKDIISHQLTHERNYSREIERELVETNRALNARPEHALENDTKEKSVFPMFKEAKTTIPFEEQEAIAHIADFISERVSVE